MFRNSFELTLLALFVSLPVFLQAQCGNPDARTWENSWRSCEPSANPLPVRGTGHWIQYDLGAVYRLSKVHVWNSNEVGKLNQGFRNVVIDYLPDGTTWSELGRYQFAQGTGDLVYGGFEGFDFDGREVRYVLITALDNWGNGTCYGLSEVKFNLWNEGSEFVDEEVEEETLSEIDLYPNPANTHTTVQIESEIEAEVEVQLTNLLGQRFHRSNHRVMPGDNNFTIRLKDNIIPGFYVVSITNRFTQERMSKRLVVVQN